ncbi:GTPase activating protein and centrosome-associated isoform X2 [Arctopsyche grandis]|uniref:GTPase activating protein and centrosome-associated isoform X2 n=1 Tax=Arctopsyche grandis TaxID=121162 RepID=UPI00406D657A
MEGNGNFRSDESLATSDEYEFVTTSASKPPVNPKLQIETTTTELERTLTEVLLETQTPTTEDKLKRKDSFVEASSTSNTLDLCREISDLNICSSMSSSSMTDGTGFCSLDNLDVEDVKTDKAQTPADTCKHVGGSKFYQDVDVGKADVSPMTPQSPKEKQDHMKPTDSDEEVSDVDQECTVFSGVSYLGAAAINAPKSELEIQRNMAILSEQRESQMGIAVAVSIPTCSQGLVVLYDAATNAVMARYAVHRILFYARGAAATPQAPCFAFTWSHGDTKESAIFQCHVFRCHIAEAVSQVSSCFAKAFERVPRSMTSSLTSECTMSGSLFSAPGNPNPDFTSSRQFMHVLECSMEIRESDTKGTFSVVPKERVGFKLRAGVDKQVAITVQQVSPNAPAGNDAQSNLNMSQMQLPGSGLVIERCFGVLLAPGRNVKHSDMQLLEMVSGGGTGNTAGTSCSISAFWDTTESALSALNVGTQDPLPVYITIAVDLVIRGMREPIRLIIETPVKVYPSTERFWYYSKKPLIQQFFINLKETIDAYGTQYEVVTLETSGELDRSRLNLTLSLYNLLPSPLQPVATSPDDDVSDGDEPLLSGTGEVSKDCCVDVLENWAQVLKSWNGERPKALSGLVKLGVPEALRGEVWQRLADVDTDRSLMDTYRLLITKDCPCESVIQRDIARTFPAHDHFREVGGFGQDSLLRLARAYAVHDSEVGYCQGLSFVAATLLLHMPEEQAFCVLVKLMYSYGLRELYKDGFEVLTLRLYQLHRLMEEHMEDLRNHFANMGVEPHMFASQWFLTLFTARFPLPLVFHIVDIFLLQGMDTLFQVALALLAKSKKDLMQLDFEGILKYFRVTLPKKCRAEEVSRQILKHACSIKVKRLAKYQQDFVNLTKEVTETEQMGNELDHLRKINEQLMQDKTTLNTQLTEIRETLRRDSERAMCDAARSAAIVQEYKDICSRLDQQLSATKDAIRGCNTCSNKLNSEDNKRTQVVAESDIGPQERIRELELELAQVKLAHVEAQCTNQELTHQLNTAVAECQTAIANQKQSWPPWLSRTLGSIKEAAQNSRPTFQTYLSSSFVPAETGQSYSSNSHQQPIRRQDSFPLSNQMYSMDAHQRRDSEPHSPRMLRNRDITKHHSMLADLNLSANQKQYDDKKFSRKSQDVSSAVIDSSIG